MSPLQYNPGRLMSNSEGLARALAMQRLQQGNALQRMEMDAAQQQQAAQRNALQRQQSDEALTQRLFGMPTEQPMPQGMAGPGAPMPNQGIDPRTFMAQGGSLGSLQKVLDFNKAMQPPTAPMMNVSPGGAVFDPQTKQPVFTAPFKPDKPAVPQIAQLQEFRDSLPAGDPRRREVQSVIDNQTRAPKYASAPGPAPAGTGQPGGGKPMTELQVTKRRDQIAKDHKAAMTTLANMDDLVASANEVLTAPGLKGATGLQSYFPSWPDGGAARAEVKLKNLEGKVTQLGKAAAAMAGAIGPMAVQEWKIVRDMIAAIEPQKGEEALKEQIRIVEATAQGAAQRIREAYERQYSPDFERFPEFQDLPEPKQKAVTPVGPDAWDDAKKQRYEAWKRTQGGGQ